MARETKGGYFPYCQWCKYDGDCELKHNEFRGLPPNPSLNTPRFSHENLAREFVAFQNIEDNGSCTGRIVAEENIYLPLVCGECHCAVPSLAMQGGFYGLCRRFDTNQKGQERMKLARQIAREQGGGVSDIDPELLPPGDPDYRSVMNH